MAVDQATYDLMDRILFGVELEEGRAPEFVVANSLAHVTNIQIPRRNGRKYSFWTPEEDQFLRQNHGWMTEEEIAKVLGRPKNAIHLRWKRDLHLPAPSRHPDYLTANQAALMIGLDAHKLAHWCDVGLIPARALPSERHIRIIHRTSFDRWVTSPANWIYFNWRKIPDLRLRKLCALRAKRWGDEWWTTVQVAKYHGVESKDVLRLIKLGKIPGVQVATSLGGRHKDPSWKNWFVRKSDAIEAVFIRGRGSGHEVRFTRRAERWMLKAHRKGLSFQAIARTMGSKCDSQTIKKNVLRLLEEKK